MKQLVLTIFLLILNFVNGFTQNFTEIIKHTPADREADDQLGNAVDISGDYAIVGAFRDDFGGSENHGSVYIYKRVGINDWVQHQKLFPSDQVDYDRFGFSVAIDGDYAVVGSYRNDFDAAGLNNLSNAGAAYIFEKDISGNWSQAQKIVASDRQMNDEFGFSVSISGNTAIVGAQSEDHNPAGGSYIYSAGSVYSYVRNMSGVWIQSQKICASDRSADINYPAGYSGEDLGDQFGWSIGISGDYLIVGALHHDYGPVPPGAPLWSSGAAYIFERTAGVWNQVQKIQNFDRESWDRFGCAVAIDTNVLIVGAYSEDELEDGVSGSLTNPGSAYLFERNLSGTWVFTQKIVPDDRNSGDHFGYQFALEDSLLVISCHSDNQDEFDADTKADAGSAYIFEKNGGTWSQFQKIDASDRVTMDEFGISVGLSDNTIVVGALFQDFNSLGLDSLEDAGAVYFFSNEICPILITDQTFNLCFGESVTVGSNTYSTDGVYADLLTSFMGCDSSVNTTLSISPEISSTNSTSVCFGGGATIGGTFYNVTGVYPVVLTAVNTCDSTIYTTLIVEPEITATQNVSICYGETYTIGLNTYSVSGTFVDVVSATNFCDSVVTTNLTVQLPITASISQNLNYLTAVTIGATYQWVDCNTNLPIPGATNQVYTATVLGNYAVAITENGCTDASACVNVNEFLVGISENNLADMIQVFPNPNNGNFQIKILSTNSSFLKFHLINSLGEEVLLIQHNDILTTATTLNSGIYLLRISNGDVVAYEKIVVTN